MKSKTEIDNVFISPHWKFGPHIDVILNCNNDTFQEYVKPLAEELLGGWLKGNPSSKVINEAEYEALSHQLALVEIEPPPYLPLLENNSISYPEYKQNKTLKLEGFVNLKEEFLADSLDLCFDLIDLKRKDKDKFFVCLALMMAIAGQRYKNGGLSRGFNSFRSHTEFFYNQYDQQGKLRLQFDALYKKYKDALDTGVKAVLENNLSLISSDKSIVSLLDDWERITIKLAEGIEEVVSRNHSYLKDETVFTDSLKEFADEIPKEYHYGENPGPMAKAIDNDVGLQMIQSKEFIAYRTLVNFYYFLLPILNVPAAQKFCVCNMTASSVENLLDISWKDLMIPGYTEQRRGVAS